MQRFKRYKNRKLYCPTFACYVTVTDLLQKTKDGLPFVVICNETGRDVTGLVLAQGIVAENYPVEVLKEFIRSTVNRDIDADAKRISKAASQTPPPESIVNRLSKSALKWLGLA